MPQPSYTILLNDRSIESLVAAASLADSSGSVIALYVHDQKPNDERRYICFENQVKTFGFARSEEVSLPMWSKPSKKNETDLATSFDSVCALTEAVSLAMRTGARRIIWPARVGDEFDDAAQITETVLLTRQMAVTWGIDKLVIETPLLELTYRQLIEVGHSMSVPWRLAWSCDEGKKEPCGLCPACNARLKAFSEAGIDDTSDSIPAVAKK